MPELGEYATYVLGSYGASILILAVLILVSLRAAARARRELDRLEARHGRKRKGGQA